MITTHHILLMLILYLLELNRITNDAREDEMEENMGQVNTMIGKRLICASSTHEQYHFCCKIINRFAHINTQILNICGGGSGGGYMDTTTSIFCKDVIDTGISGFMARPSTQHT